MRKELTLFVMTFLFAGSLLAQIVNIEDRRLDHQDSSQLAGFLDLGASLTQNSNQIITLQASGQLELLAKRHLWMLYGDYRQVVVNENDAINQGVLHARYNYGWKDWLTWEAFAQGQENEKLRIHFRGLLGTGPRFNLRPKSEGKGDVFIGLSYMYEYEAWTDTSTVFRDSRISSYISFDVALGPQVSLTSTNYFQPLISNFNLYRLSSNSSLMINISKALAFRLGFSVTLDNRLGELPGIPITTYQLTNSLRFRF